MGPHTLQTSVTPCRVHLPLSLLPPCPLATNNPEQRTHLPRTHPRCILSTLPIPRTIRGLESKLDSSPKSPVHLQYLSKGSAELTAVEKNEQLAKCTQRAASRKRSAITVSQVALCHMVVSQDREFSAIIPSPCPPTCHAHPPGPPATCSP